MRNKNILVGLVSLFSVSFLTGCGNDSVSDSSTSVNNIDNQTDEINIIKNDKLAVDQNKCVGCGKCARIASANFEMTQSHKAQVKSTEITNQKLIDNAVAVCPTKAITQ
jgi:ferredoxin